MNQDIGDRVTEPPRGAHSAGGDARDDLDATLRVDAYSAKIVPVTPQQRDLLYELTVSVFWPHRNDDLDLFISLGHGYIALDEIGRPLGSAMYFSMGDDFAMLGMMVTPPRLQAQGAGRWLLRRIMRDCGTRDLRLSATRSGYRLYESAGFIPVGPIRQHQGIVRPVSSPDPVSGIALAAVSPADSEAIKALDAHAFGADRGGMLDALLDLSSGVIATRAGKACGFALMRRFGKGQVIGPVVAETEQIALQIIAPLIARSEGTFLRMDIPAPGSALSSFLTASGMALFDTVTEMRIGPQRRASEGAVTFGLAAHSLG